MAVVADVDGLDLWVEPSEWSDEQRDEVRRFIEERRGRGTDPQLSERAAALLSRIRGSAVAPPPPAGDPENPVALRPPVPVSLQKGT